MSQRPSALPRILQILVLPEPGAPDKTVKKPWVIQASKLIYSIFEFS